jgi:NADH-quinone oxidoreductase subunit N
MNFTADLIAVLPFAFLVLWASALLLIDVFLLQERRKTTVLLAALGLVITIVLSIAQSGQQEMAFNNMISLDGFAVFLNTLFLVSGLIAVGLSYDYLQRMGIERGEYYPLLLFSISGMLLMSYAADLIVIFLALELLSIPLYVLAGFARPRLESEESAMKYFLLGAFASGFLVYGIALIFGGTATTNLSGIYDAVAAGLADSTLLAVGAGLVLVGLGFKVGAVPFHMWTPDVYQGAPSTITAFMAIGAKAGGFAAILRVFVIGFSNDLIVIEKLTAVLWGLAVITMIVGNVMAISQRNIKRMLAYSSISHAGFILMALVPFAQPEVALDTVASALFYLVAFALTSFGAWAVVLSLEQNKDNDDGSRKGQDLYDDYAGLGHKHAGLALAMTVFMLSFTGLPPTLGFAGKLYLFRTVLAGGHIWLAIIGVLTSLISAYYYLRVVIIMYMHDGEPLVYKNQFTAWTARISAIGVVLLTIFATPLFRWAAAAVLGH